jgi:RNA polymerase sigma-70 factor (ECF subfamily)
MPDEHEAFHDLMRRVQARDEQAAEELVRLFEPTVRLVVRRRLTDPRLRRLLDSMDICQSVLGTFFAGAANGRFALHTPDQLVKLLVTMARNKLISCTRAQKAARRNPRGVESLGSGDVESVDPCPTPTQLVADREILKEIRERLSPEELRIADLYAAGRSWQEIAAEVGGRPDQLRMRFRRALDRVRGELGLGETGTVDPAGP